MGRHDLQWASGAGVLLVWTAACGLAEAPRAAAPGVVEFNRDIRPILSDNCFQCHGPDAKARKAELRLDREEEATGPRKDGPAIVRGKPAESELVRRIATADPNERMPPAESGKKLTSEQVELLRRW